jgi:hypothetical protein
LAFIGNHRRLQALWTSDGIQPVIFLQPPVTGGLIDESDKHIPHFLTNKAAARRIEPFDGSDNPFFISSFSCL